MNLMIEDDDLFRRCIVQRHSRITENQPREARRDADRMAREEDARFREEDFSQEVDLSQEASVVDDPSTVDSQLERLDLRVEKERKKKLKK